MENKEYKASLNNVSIRVSLSPNNPNGTKYSYSQISSFHNCPLEWYHQYILHTDGEGNCLSDYGTYGHAKIEELLRGDKLQYEILEDIQLDFDNIFTNGISINFGGFNKNLTNGYYTSLYDYVSDCDYLESLNILDIEKKFMYSISIESNMEIQNNFTFIFTGIADIIAQDKEGNYYIVDLKSKGSFKNSQELKEYTRQLYLYSLYVFFTYGVWPKELWFEQFRVGKRVKIKFEEVDLKEALEWLVEGVTTIELGNFKVEGNPDPFYCNNLCSYRNKNICEG